MRVGVGAALVLTVATFAPPVRAQESEIDALAKQAAAALRAAHSRDVVVLDFTGTPEMAALGERLTSDFRDALARESGGAANFKIEDRAATLDRATEMSLTLANFRDPATFRWAYAGTSVDAWITGEISDSGGADRKLAIVLHRVADGGEIALLSSTIPFPPDLQSLVTAAQPDEFASMPVNGAVGYAAAKCISCPQAVFSTEALRAHAQGTVILSFTIDKHGRTKEVRVKQAMPDGLTQQAIDAVLDWKFTPAKDPRGKKIQVRQTTAVEFHK